MSSMFICPNCQETESFVTLYNDQEYVCINCKVGYKMVDDKLIRYSDPAYMGDKSDGDM